jgi:hypothetical protein
VKTRIWEEAGWWHYDVRGQNMRVTGARRKRQDAVDEAAVRGRMFCASIRELTEAGALPS